MGASGERIAVDANGAAWVSAKTGIYFNGGNDRKRWGWYKIKDQAEFRASDIAAHGTDIVAVGLRDQKVFRLNKNHWKKVAGGPNAAAIALGKDGNFFTTMI